MIKVKAIAGYGFAGANMQFEEEFDVYTFCDCKKTIEKMALYMQKHKDVFVNEDKEGSILKNLWEKWKWLVRALVPFIENLICFIPFFMLNNRTVGSQYFANLDPFPLYVLLFAIVYGQQQATFSAICAVAGYMFRQMYTRTGFEVLLDYNTYVWIAQLFTGAADWSLVGGEGEVACIGREAGSGTRDGFESITGTEDTCVLSQELTSTGAVIEAVKSNPAAIGYASLSAVEGQEGIKMVTVDGVACSEETVQDGTYKIQRPFVMVTNSANELSEPAQAFMDFALSDAADDLIRDAGAVPMAE